MVSAGGGHLKHEDKRTLCCPSSVTFGDWQAVCSGSSVLGTAPWEMSRSGQVRRPQHLLERGQGARQEAPAC